MPCQSCEKDPQFHNFVFLSRTQAGEGVYYTCPAKGKERKPTKESVIDYVEHMDEASVSGWVWIFDCKDLDKVDMPHISVLQMFTELFQERYRFVLKKIYIVNPNWKMQVILSSIRPFLKEETKKRLQLCDSPLHLLAQGFHTDVVKAFM
jgi:hypothetical protein